MRTKLREKKRNKCAIFHQFIHAFRSFIWLRVVFVFTFVIRRRRIRFFHVPFSSIWIVDGITHIFPWSESDFPPYKRRWWKKSDEKKTKKTATVDEDSDRKKSGSKNVLDLWLKSIQLTHALYKINIESLLMIYIFSFSQRKKYSTNDETQKKNMTRKRETKWQATTEH